MGQPGLLLHCNGNDASTVFTDSSPTPHSISPAGNAQIDQANKKFGTGSCMLDGTGDWLTAAGHADFADIFNSVSSDWTIDFWCKMNAVHAFDYFITYFVDINNRWLIRHKSASGWLVSVIEGGGAAKIETSQSGIVADALWHHYAICKVGTIYGAYLDGTQIGYDSTSNTVSFGTGGTLYIGQGGSGSDLVNGYLDEIHIIPENIFTALPNAGLTDTITVPVSEHPDAGGAGTISGTIKDADGNAVNCELFPVRMNVYQKLNETQPPTSTQLIISSGGTFSFTGLNVGTKYLITAEYEGAHEPSSTTDIANCFYATAA